MTLSQLGRYHIIGTLGHGAMGTVYRAHDPLIDRTVAIKTVSYAGFSREESESFEERFYREAKSAGRLNHPNIVTIHDVGRSGDLAYIAMEFLDGRSLRQILDSGVVLPLETIAKIVIQIAEGLAFAHANGVVHRDIKPANIMVQDNYTVKITDFGVAQLPSAAQGASGTTLGSPKYMSPEQIAGKKADGRSDIFSLGVVFYEMLTGRPPFNGESLDEVLDKVLHTAPPLPSSFNHELPQGFDRIVARAMAKDPDKRYQKAADMAAHVRKYRRLLIKARQDQGKTAQPPLAPAATPAAMGPGAETVQIPTLPKPLPPAARNARPRLPRMLLPLVLAALAVLLAGGWWVWHRAPPPVAVAGHSVAPAPVAPPVVTAPPTASPASSAPVPAVAAAPPNAKSATPETPAPESPPAENGSIQLAISPWGEVYVDGKKVGISPPLNVVRLPAGKHSVEIRNAGFKPYRQTLNLAPDGNLRIKHKFE